MDVIAGPDEQAAAVVKPGGGAFDDPALPSERGAALVDTLQSLTTGADGFATAERVPSFS